MARTAKRVLVVDDDGDMRSLYRCWLVAAEEVRTAADGVEALQRLEESVDVVLLDREMPRKDGVSVARELERRAIDPAVVMISGVEPDLGLLDIPVDDYLRKPVTRETVRERVERAVAAAASPPRNRRLVALDTRRRIVEAAVPRHRLAEDPTYQRIVDRLARERPRLDDAHASVPPACGQADGEQTVGSFDGASREPRQ